MATHEHQHVVPKLYLRGFADARGVVAVRRRTGAIKAIPVKNVAVRKDFYSFETATGLLDRSIEPWFGHNIENSAGPVLERLRRGGHVGDGDRVPLGRFVAAQLLRSPAMDELMQEVDGHLGPFLIQQHIYSQYRVDPRAMSELDQRRVARAAADAWRRESGSPDRRSRLRTMFREMDKQASDFCTRVWTVLRSSTPLLVARDAPVVTFNRTVDGGWLGLVPQSSAVMMPLSPRALLLGEVAETALSGPLTLTQETARWVNEKQAFEASDVLINAPGLPWPRGLRLTRERASFPPPTIRWSRGRSGQESVADYPEVRDSAIEQILHHLSADNT